MNATLKAVIVELSGGNIRNDHINLRGTLGMFPDDSLGGSNKPATSFSIFTRRLYVSRSNSTAVSTQSKRMPTGGGRAGSRSAA
jgi:hypothetical protein